MTSKKAQWKTLLLIPLEIGLLLSSVSVAVAADTSVSGNITSNTTWTLENSPYDVTSSITVSNGATLTIQAGVIVRFSPGTTLTIGSGTTSFGTLKALGTEEAPILMTAANGLTGSWNYVRFLTADNQLSILRNVTIEKGTYGVRAENWGTNLLIDNVTIQHVTTTGLYLTGDSDPTVKNLRIHGAVVNGIEDIGTTGSLTLTDVTIMASSTAIKAPATRLVLTNVTIQGSGRQIVGNFVQDFTNVEVGGLDPSHFYVETHSVSTTTTVRELGRPYYVSGTVSVISGTTLTIEPGVHIDFDAAAILRFGSSGTGILRAEGTQEQPILLTAASAIAGGWNYVQFLTNDAPTSVLRNVTVEKGTYGIRAENWGTNLVLDNVTIQDVTTVGLYLTGDSDPAVKNLQVHRTGVYGVQDTATGTLTLIDATFTGATGIAIYAPLNHLALTNVDIENAGRQIVGNFVQDFTGVRIAGDDPSRYYIETNSVSTSTVVRELGIPYHIQGTVTVTNGATLTIEPGATLEFDPAAILQVSLGALRAEGTKENPIVLTAANGLTGGWGSLRFATGDTGLSILRNVTVDRPTDGIKVENWGTNLRIDNVSITDASNVGLLMTGDSNPAVRNLNIHQAGVYGIQDTAAGTVTLEDVTITGTSGTAIYAPLADLALTRVATSLDGKQIVGTFKQDFQEVSVGGADPSSYFVGPHTVSTSATVRNLGVPYQFAGTVNVASGSTLTLEPGLQLKGESGALLQIQNGRLLAEGTVDEPILLTSAGGSIGGWDSLTFSTNDVGMSIIRNTTVERGINGVVANSWGPNLNLDNVTIRDVTTSGLVLSGDSDPHTKNLLISGAPTHGVHDKSSGVLNLRDTKIEGFGLVSIYAPTSTLNLHNVTVEASGEQIVGKFDQILSDVMVGGRPVDIKHVAGATIASSLTIPSSDLPYHVNGPYVVRGPATLTIEPGVELQFDSGEGLSFEASTGGSAPRLLANGTADEPIIFTSTSGKPGGWAGITLQSVTGLRSYISNTQIHDATTGLTLSAWRPGLTLTDVTIDAPTVRGIDLTSISSLQATRLTIKDTPSAIRCQSSSTVTLSQSWIESGATGVSLTNCSSSSLEDNNFERNPTYAVSATNTATSAPTIDAKQNYWGSPSGPSGNAPGTGNRVTGPVEVDPWLTGPASFTPTPELVAISGPPLGSISLSWPSLDDATTYSVQRAPFRGGPFEDIADDVTTTTYVDNELFGDSKLFYQIIGKGANGITVGKTTVDGATPAVTAVSGTISSSTTWSLANSPYQVTGTVTVAGGAVLTVQPGVVVTFKPGTMLRMGSTTPGTLHAEGTEAQPILFTASNGNAGGWSYLHFNQFDNQLSIMRNVTVEKGTSGIYAQSWGTNLVLDRVTVQDVTSNGIKLDGDSAPTIRDLRINRANVYGIHDLTTGSLVLDGVTITGNRGTAIYAPSEALDLHNVDIELGGRQIIGAFTQDFDNVLVGGQPPAAFYVGAHTVSAAVTVRDLGIPYDVEGTIAVTGNRILNIEPGTRIEMRPSAILRIGSGSQGSPGTLRAEGTQSAPIVFTSQNGAIGGWSYIHFDGADNQLSVLRNVTVEKAVYGIRADSWGANLELDNVTVQDVTSRALYLTGDTKPLVKGLAINRAKVYGIHHTSTATLSLRDTTITGVAGIAIYAPSANLDLSNIAIANGGKQIVGTFVQDFDNVLVGGQPPSRFYVGGHTLTAPTTVRDLGLPYDVEGNVIVNANRLLTIAPGTRIEMRPSTSLIIGGTSRGTLLAEGTEADPIILTAQSGLVGGWSYLYFDGPANQMSVLRNVTIEKAVYGVRAANSGTNLELDNVTIQHISSLGIYLTGDSRPDIHDVTINQATQYGIYHGGPTTVAAERLVILGNLGTAIYAPSSDLRLTDTTISNAGKQIVGSFQQDLTDVAVGGSAPARFYVGPHTLSRSSTVRDLGLPYDVGSVTVINNARLTIEAGVRMEFLPGALLQIARSGCTTYASTCSPGTLIAEGTAAEPIVLTAKNGVVGGWNYLAFISTDNQPSVIRNATIEKGVYGVYVSDWGKNLVIDNVTIRDVSNYGLRLLGDSNPEIRNLRIHNATYGIHAGNPIMLKVHGLTVTGARTGAVYAPTSSLNLTDVDVASTGNQIIGNFVQDFVNVRVGGVPATAKHVAGHSLTKNTFVRASEIPYHVLGQVTVPGPHKLTLQNGTELSFEPAAAIKLISSGSGKPRLLVEGSPDSPVHLHGATGPWEGLKFEAAAIAPESRINHTIIEGAKTAILATGWQPRLYLDNVTIRSSSVRGIDILSSSWVQATQLNLTQAPSAIRCQTLGTLTLVHSYISSGTAGVELNKCSASVITNTTFVNNPTFAVSATNSDIIDAEFNFWGHATGPSGIGAGLGDKALGSVDYDPWLEQPGSYVPLPDVKAPTNLHAMSGPGLGSVFLNWTAPIEPTLSFGVYRSLDPRLGFVNIANVTGGSTNYQDGNLLDGTTYYYRVTSRNLAGSEGTPSFVIGGSPPGAPSAPQALKAQRTGADVQLDWLPPIWDGGRPISSYTVEVAMDGDGNFTAIAVLGPVTTHNVPACDPECHYRVVALNELGNSVPSNEAAALPRFNNFPAEAIRGTTPAAGGALKEVFPCQQGSGGSVNVVTGQLVASTCLFKAASPFGLDLVIQATHRTHAATSSLAPNWELSVHRRLVLDDDGDAVLFDGSGRADRLEASGNDFTSPPGFYQRLNRLPSGWYDLESPGGLHEIFDAQGDRVAVRDSVGNALHFTHDSHGRVVQAIDAVGRRVTFVNDADRLKSIHDWSGRTVVLGYDAQGDLGTLEFRAPNAASGPRHRFDYESHALISAASPSSGRYMLNEYHADGRIINQTMGRDSRHSFQYDAEAKTTRVLDPNGNAVQWTYKSLEEQVPIRKEETLRNRDPVVTTYQSNANLEISKVTLPKGNSQEWSFDASNANPLARGNVLSSTQRATPGSNAAPLVTTNTYEATFQGVKSVTNPLGNDPSYTPQNGGSPLGRYTTRLFYGQDEEANSQDLNGDGVIGAPAGKVIRIELPTANSEGVPIDWMLPGSGVQRRTEVYEYNARGQVTKHTGLDGSVTSYSYYGAGLQYPEGSLKSLKRTNSLGTPPGGSASGQAEFRSFMMAAAEEPPAALAGQAPEGMDYEIVFTYNEAGNVDRVASPGGQVTEFVYDEFDRPIEVRDAAGLETTMAYDGDGNLVAQNRTNAIQQPDGTFIIDALNPVLSDRFVYDELGRVVETIRDAARPAGAPPSDAPTELREKFVYDPNGNLVRHLLPSAVSGENPNMVETFVYDERNQLVSQTSGSNTTIVNGNATPVESTTLYLRASASQVAQCPAPSTLSSWESCGQGSSAECPGGESATVSQGRTICLPPARHPEAKPGLVRAGSLPSARSGAGAVWDAASGKAYVIGGVRAPNVLDEIVEYDPVTETSAVVARLPGPRWEAATAFDGRYVYVFGGCSTTSCAASTMDTVFRFDTVTNAVTSMRNLPGPLRSASAVWDGSSVYLLGGCYATCSTTVNMLRSVLRYDPIADATTSAGVQLPTRLNTAATAWDDDAQQATLLGGVVSGRTNQILRFDPHDGSATLASEPLDSARNSMAAAWNGSAAYAFGGYDAARLGQIVRYEPGSDRTITMTTTLPSPGYRLSAVWATDFALIFGGDYATGGTSTAIYKFKPEPVAPTPPHHPVAAPGPVTGQTMLYWQAPNATGSTELLSYTIYRRTAMSEYETVGSVPASQRHFVDNTTNPAETYSYAVAAVNGDLESARSTEALSIGTPEFPTEGPVQLCPSTGIIVDGNQLCPPVDECPANTIGAIVEGQMACATIYGCPDGHIGVVIDDQSQCFPVPLCPPTSGCPHPNQLACYLPEPCHFILNGTLATHVGSDGIGIQIGGQEGTSPPTIEDNDGYPIEVEAAAGSNPWYAQSTPLTDDDGDGRINQLESPTAYQYAKAYCTGAYGYVASPCAGYTEPPGYSTLGEGDVFQDSTGKTWVWDSVCVPALDGDYQTCKTTGNKALSSTTYTGGFTGDGYGWRRIAASSGQHVEYYGPCANGITDADADGIPTIALCRHKVRLNGDGTITSVSSQPWRTVGDPNPRAIVVYVPLWGMPYGPQPPVVDTDPQPDPAPPAGEPGWKWTFSLDEVDPGNGTAKGAPNRAEAPAHAAWQWTPPNGTFDFQERHVQLKFWAVQDGNSPTVIANRWNARLYADDDLVATTNPESGTLLPMAADGKPVEYVIDLGTESFNGSALRLELDLGATPAGRLVLFDDADFPSRLEFTTGSTRVTEYDANGDITVQVDALGRITRIERDDFGRAANVTLPDGTRIASSFDPVGQPVLQEHRAPIDLSREDEEPGESMAMGSFRMMAEGNTVQETGGLLQRTLRHFDEAGRLYREDVALLDEYGNALPDEGLIPGDGYATTLYEYDLADRLVRKTEDNFAVHSYEYDGMGRLVRETDPVGNVVERSYDERSNLLSETLLEFDGTSYTPHRTVFGYDDRSQLIRVTDSLGQTVRTGYDGDGNVAWVTDAKGPPMEDPDGLYNGTINGHGNIVHYTYDALGRLLATNRVLTSTGDSTGTVTGSLTTIQEWDADGRLVKQVDAKGQATTYTYNDLGNLIAIGYADGSQKRFQYDAVNNPTAWIDANGVKVRQDFDTANRVVRRSVESGEVGWSTLQTMTYDSLGRLSKATDNNDPAVAADDSEVTFAYDSLSRTTRETQNGRTVTRSYDGINDVGDLTYSNGRVVHREYDVMKRLTAVSDESGALRTYTYSGLRLVASTSGSAATTTYSHDDLLRPTVIQHTLASGTLSFTSLYDRAGQRIAEIMAHAPTWSTQASYDSLGRLASLQRSNFANLTAPEPLSTDLLTSATWTLDGANNWQAFNGLRNGQLFSQARTFDQTNALTGIFDGNDSVEVEHDDNGNRLADDRFTYAWDAFNRLRSVKDISGETVATYGYDALGRRIAKTVGNDTAHFIYDGVDVIEEYNGTGALMRQFVHGSEINHPLLMDTDLDGDGIATGAGDRRLHYLQDGLGSVVGLVDKAGQLVEGYLYDAYGQTAVIRPGANGVVDWGADDVVADRSNVGNPYGFTGQRLDAETGLYYFRARYFAPMDGVFLSHDPIGVWGDAMALGNAYGYVGGDPLTMFDPLGQKGCSIFNPKACLSSAANTAKNFGNAALDIAAGVGNAVIYGVGGATATLVTHGISQACGAVGASACQQWASGQTQQYYNTIQQQMNPGGQCLYTDKVWCHPECNGSAACALSSAANDCFDPRNAATLSACVVVGVAAATAAVLGGYLLGSAAAGTSLGAGMSGGASTGLGAKVADTTIRAIVGCALGAGFYGTANSFKGTGAGYRGSCVGGGLALALPGTGFAGGLLNGAAGGVADVFVTGTGNYQSSGGTCRRDWSSAGLTLGMYVVGGGIGGGVGTAFKSEPWWIKTIGDSHVDMTVGGYGLIGQTASNGAAGGNSCFA